MADGFQEYVGVITDVKPPQDNKPLKFTVESDKGNGFVDKKTFSAFEATKKNKPIPAFRQAPQLQGQQVKVAFTVYDNGKYTNYNAWSVEAVDNGKASGKFDAPIGAPATNGGDSNLELVRWITQLEERIAAVERHQMVADGGF